MFASRTALNSRFLKRMGDIRRWGEHVLARSISGGHQQLAEAGTHHNDRHRDQHDGESQIDAGNIASPSGRASCASKARGAQWNPDEHAADQTRRVRPCKQAGEHVHGDIAQHGDGERDLDEPELRIATHKPCAEARESERQRTPGGELRVAESNREHSLRPERKTAGSEVLLSEVNHVGGRK
jgi:hypothetical protein